MDSGVDQGSLDLDEAIQYGTLHNRFSKNTEVTLLETSGSQTCEETILKGHAFKDKLEAISNEEITSELKIRTFILAWYDPRYASKTPVSITPEDMSILCRTFGIMPLFIRGAVEASNWVRMGNGLFINKDDTGKCSSIDLFYRYFNGKPRGRSYLYTRYDLNRNAVTNIWINSFHDPQRVLNDMVQSSSRPDICRYFDIHATIVPHCLGRLTSDGARLRDQVIQEENGPHNLQPKAKAESLHKLASELHSLIEYLYDLEDLIAFLIKASNRISAAVDDKQTKELLQNTDLLEQIHSTTAKAGRWVTSFRDRTNLRINLAFHLSTQADSDTNLQISTATKSIAHEARRDSSSMITIAAVTMFFLPGTFVSALFSMTFFNFQQDSDGKQQFQVSDKWWWYLAATIPLTAAVFAIWIVWQKWKFGKEKEEEAKEMLESKEYF